MRLSTAQLASVTAGSLLLFIAPALADAVRFSQDGSGNPETEIELDISHSAEVNVWASPGPLFCTDVSPPLCIADVLDIDTFAESSCDTEILEYPLGPLGGFFFFEDERMANRSWGPTSTGFFATGNAYSHGWGTVGITNKRFTFTGGVEAAAAELDEDLSYEVFSPFPCCPTCPMCLSPGAATATVSGGTRQFDGPWRIGIPCYAGSGDPLFVYAEIHLQLNVEDGVPPCAGGFTSEDHILEVQFIGNDKEPDAGGIKEISLTLDSTGTVDWEGWVLADNESDPCSRRDPEVTVLFDAWHLFDKGTHFTEFNQEQECEFRDTFAVIVDFDPLCNTGCPGDVTGNGVIDVDDLLAVIGAWGTPGCGGAAPCCEDFDGNGSVDTSDLLMVINGWGTCP
jgi:hypothetical protein